MAIIIEAAFSGRGNIMLPRVPAISVCSSLSLVNVVGFFFLARWAESLGYVGESGVASFTVSVGMLTMLITSALLIWAVLDHFFVEQTRHTAFNVALNFGFLCAFVIM
jgi:hypothetical protein